MPNHRPLGRAGFTILEVLIVVFIIGMMAFFAVPKYMKSSENSKADAARSLLSTVAASNRSYYQDHQRYTSGNLTSACRTATCNVGSGGGFDSVCNLIACKYLPYQNYDGGPWVIGTCDPGSSTTCGVQGFLATAHRRVKSEGPNGTNGEPFAHWSYRVDASGRMTGSPDNLSGPPQPE
ncbi:MAG: prepilin-type N-terminal cleavage/methylation domain-containing protein [Elusimicrobia bacterium]|nr:prepilin-type N-terminal cleavage/methylation domain-containing protein [Elusimicrobiota bacterium]